jgi:NDP-sugar pyrophosphorylase family protein
MKYAIIAAGEGSRLAQEGVSLPKPLVRVGDEHLIDRLIRIFADNGASEVIVICRSMDQVGTHLQQLADQSDVPLRFIVKATPSSMHSFFELSPFLGDEPFVLTTVDTVFRESEFTCYVAAFRQMIQKGEADGLMGVTDYIDDEKPLYVKDGEDGRIQAFLDDDPQPHFISAGIYGLTPRALATLSRCMERGESRMRNFQRALIADGLRLHVFPFTNVFDIDHVSDIQKAESFLR